GPRGFRPSPDSDPGVVQRDGARVRRAGSGLVSSRALDALDRVLSTGGEPDDVLRATVDVLTKEPGITWAGIVFLEEGALTIGPSAGEPDESKRLRVPIVYQESKVGELWVDGKADERVLERLAFLISAHVLIGWDTRGE